MQRIGSATQRQDEQTYWLHASELVSYTEIIRQATWIQ